MLLLCDQALLLDRDRRHFCGCRDACHWHENVGDDYCSELWHPVVVVQ
jgi:hypothetical protein